MPSTAQNFQEVVCMDSSPSRSFSPRGWIVHQGLPGIVFFLVMLLCAFSSPNNRVTAISLTSFR
jgi:hypothetical protein